MVCLHVSVVPSVMDHICVCVTLKHQVSAQTTTSSRLLCLLCVRCHGMIHDHMSFHEVALDTVSDVKLLPRQGCVPAGLHLCTVLL